MVGGASPQSLLKITLVNSVAYIYHGFYLCKEGKVEIDGNDNIHELTADSNHALMILMTDFSGVTKFAEYLSFHVSSEANGYQLMVSKYDGTAGDSLTRQNGHKFTTFDRDNDGYGSNCAVVFKGAWWYEACHSSNLNGVYYHGHHDEYATGIDWYTFHGYHYSMKTAMMMIRKY
ncbi:FCN [Mytilus edulis]|uniref:FCN n=1 Tax=Mytilus edulis TaxID=6550 RepID=A0A8S3QPP5_MYTED|nr:FCN [Mytilus edulis]